MTNVENENKNVKKRKKERNKMTSIRKITKSEKCPKNKLLYQQIML